MYSYDAIAMIHLFNKGFKKQIGEKRIPSRKEIQQQEREWRNKWYNHNGEWA